VRRVLMWVGDLVETNELLLEMLQLAADGYNLAASAAALEWRADGASVLAVGALEDELVLAVVEGVERGTESLLHVGGRCA